MDLSREYGRRIPARARGPGRHICIDMDGAGVGVCARARDDVHPGAAYAVLRRTRLRRAGGLALSVQVTDQQSEGD